MDSIGIGALAKHAGVGIDTVRYYERNGLLNPKARLASGYRRYSFVELSRLREGLVSLIAACPGHGSADDCPILKALGAEGSP